MLKKLMKKIRSYFWFKRFTKDSKRHGLDGRAELMDLLSWVCPHFLEKGKVYYTTTQIVGSDYFRFLCGTNLARVRYDSQNKIDFTSWELLWENLPKKWERSIFEKKENKCEYCN